MRTLLLLLTASATLAAQQSDFVIKLVGGTKRTIAIPDFRAAGEAQPFVEAFNRTLFANVQQSGLLDMAAKSFYPLNPPQQASDFQAAVAPVRQQPAPRRGLPAPPPEPGNCGGSCLSDWAGPPVNASYLAIGYAAAQNNQFVVFGWLYNASVPDLAGAQLFRKFYFGTLDEAGAVKVAREFAADILAQFGAHTLVGSRIHFVSDRSGYKELWVMDYDGSNQRQVTRFESISFTPGVSPDGTLLAFTTYARGAPQVMVYATETYRRLAFLSPRASMNATPDFTPDGKQMLFASTLTGGYSQIYLSNIDGSGLRPLTHSRAVEVEPKVNPKTGSEIAFVSGRGGLQQIYRMNIDGADVSRLSNGEGEAANPAWHPEGRHIAFKWTRGFAPGNWNVFIMDVASRETVQLTHGEGRNENPSWAPDGRHLVFSSNRTGRYQLYSVLADGSGLRQLTTQGNNTMPVWSK